MNYVKKYNEISPNNIFHHPLSGNFGQIGGIITEIVAPNGRNYFFSNFGNSSIARFLSNHSNDNQFENLINIIISYDAEHQGNPPASEKVIKNLNKEKVNKDNINKLNEEPCNVCLENYTEEQISVKLNCGHRFHDSCIIHWLKMRNTCPVCRYELESDDKEYERRKHSHRENLRNIQRNNNNNGNNNGNNNNGPEAHA